MKRPYSLSILFLLLFFVSLQETSQASEINGDSVEVIPQNPNQAITCDTPPKVIKSLLPEYPLSAKKSGIEGRVYIMILVDEKGRVSQSRVGKSSGNSPLDSAAIKASRGFIFAPAEFRKKPVAVWVTIPIDFKLDDEEKRIPKPEEQVKYDTPPHPILTPQPEWPPLLLGEERTLYLELLIDLDGSVMEVRIVKGMGSVLDNTAIEAAKKYKYKPAKYKGKSVRAWVTIPIIIKRGKI